MADSINRIVPPSVSVDRGTELRRERTKTPGDRRRKPKPGAEPAPDNQPEAPATEPAESDRDKGQHLDINA